MFFCPCKPKIKKSDDDLRFNPLETPKEKIIKIVLLGPSDSGKTTIIKQFRKFSGSLNTADINNMAPYIKENIVTNMKRLCAQSLLLEQESKPQTAVSQTIHHLRNEMLAFTECEPLTQDIAFKINKLWTEDAIKATLQQRHLFQIDENVSYFFDKINEIASDDYDPTFEDYVRIRRISSGYCMTKFMKSIDNFGEYYFEVLDIGGARSERKKWWSHGVLLDMVDLNAVIYTVPISDYNLTLFEDNKTNRLKEAITLFKDTMIKSDCFNDAPLFLLFNKYDAFVEKIKEVPITCCFEDFPSDTMDAKDPDQVIHFVAGKFTQVFKDCDVKLKGPLRIHKTSAIDTESIETMFNKIMPHIMRRNVGSYHEIH